MDVDDALAVVVDHAQHIAPGKAHVPGVIQQPDRRPGVPHQQIQVALGLDGGRHVVVKGERHAGFGAVLGEAGEAAAVGFDFIFRELAARGERGLALVLHRAGGFAVGEAGSAEFAEQPKLRRDPVLFLRQVVGRVQHGPGVPAGGELEAVCVQLGAPPGRGFREFAAGLPAG